MRRSPRFIDLQDFSTREGNLNVVESSKDLDFIPKRVYFFHRVPEGQERGFHAHKTLTQCLVAVNGSVEIELSASGRTQTFLLNDPTKGLLVPPGHWRVMRNFSPPLVLLVLASDLYDETDYIHDFDAFLRWEEQERERESEVPYLDLKRRYAETRAEMMLAADRVMASGRYILGESVTNFEREFCAISETKYAIGVGSGLAALTLVLQSWGIGAGDEVIVPANSYVASALAVTLAGATPVFVDADPATCNLAVAELDTKITPRTKAIMPVHLYGLPAEMDGILSIARRHGLHVLEDAAQAHGARYKDRACGGLGDAAAFSFYPTKNIGAVGDAGIVCTNDESLAEQVSLRRNVGAGRRNCHEVLGQNSRLDELQAALLLVQLKKLEPRNARRRRLADRYLRGLRDVRGLRLPTVPSWAKPAWHVFAVEVMSGSRDDFTAHLTEHGIGYNIHYPAPIHLQPCYDYLGYRKGSFPCAEALAGHEVSLPLDASHTDEEIDRVIEVVRSYFS